MSFNIVNLNPNNNRIVLTDVNRVITINELESNKIVRVLQPHSQLVSVITAGPAGEKGNPTDTSSFVLNAQTSSMSVLSASYALNGSPLTTKGDIFTYSTVNTRLPASESYYILSLDPNESTGLKWVPGITVSATPPSNPIINQLWYDIS